MKNRTHSKAMLSAAIVVGWMWLTAAECGDVTNPRPIQNCRVTYDPDFPTGGTVSLNKPATCPIKLVNVLRIPYAATADLPAGSVIYNSFQSHFVDRSGRTGSMITNAVWSQGNLRYFVNITSDYYAGQGGFDANDEGYDDIHNSFNKGNWTTAIVRIPYQFGAPSNTISAPSTVPPSAPYTVSATTNDPLLVGPLTWSWYVDGTFYGTTNSPEMTVQAGGPNASQTIQVVASDPDGRSVSGQATVWMGSACGVNVETC